MQEIENQFLPVFISLMENEKNEKDILKAVNNLRFLKDKKR